MTLTAALFQLAPTGGAVVVSSESFALGLGAHVDDVIITVQ
jgi:hypothetical protein